ncbi:TetR-like C-terminal domain-containing protein [Streptomyces sp. NPDC014793]|uniref:TetR-like C-terminal domain-containing protein n=1 Tax=Streptomyces sp. NPDC014793 TaxID=3364914 RepID=UPI0036FE803D
MSANLLPDKHAVEVEPIAQLLTEAAEALETAEPRDPGSLEALADAYRDHARAHPHLYCLATEHPLPRAELPTVLEDRAALPQLRACGHGLDPARAAWAFAHGMVILEIHGRFPHDADLETA